ncbi:lipopolysaccharide transport periplasmic protein LptA [Shimia sp. SDUM112013]|uniref:lipopolysaccharide transport periplasmic protein LptA n=1 Tax=Shimia sp. SDUM112013 TaxID=3136160 RepID=UPI0032EDB142
MPFKVIVALLFFCVPVSLLAQNFQIAFGGLQQDTSQPVQVTSDNLSLNQKDGSAVFDGNVLIVQGEMRLSAPSVSVFYNQDNQGISRMIATGRVLLVKSEDAAEADTAEYDVDAGTIVMSGNVLLSQGVNTLASDKMTVDLESGAAQMHGRVKTIMRSEDDN